MHDWFTPLARLVKVTLRGVWVVRPVGADQIGHGAEGFCCPPLQPVGPPDAVGKRGPGKCQNASQWEAGWTITRHPASNLERDDLG